MASMDQRLLKAARSGNLNVIKKLVDEESNILIGTTPQGNNVLHIAIRFGHWSVVQEVMKRNPHCVINTNHKGETSVHVAAKGGDTTMAQSFIESVQALEEYFRNAEILFQTARLTDNDGNTPLHCAVRKRNISLMETLAVRDRDALLLLNQTGESPLSIAVDLKLPYCIKKIIKLNPRALDYEGSNGQTVLHLAVIRRDVDIMRMILERKPDLINSKDDKQRTPLHYAAFMGEYNIVEVLLRRSDASTAYEEDHNNQIPLHLAAENGQVKSLKALLNSYPDTIELLDKEQKNILHIAAQNGNIDAVLFIFELPEMEDLVNVVDEKGNTPLHLATENFHNMIVFLLSRKEEVDLRVINKEGCTALDVAQSPIAGEMKRNKHLTVRALKSAYAKRSMNPKDVVDKYELEVEDSGVSKQWGELGRMILMMTTLIATFTFMAAFAIPGGFRNEDPNAGTANLIKKPAFQAFIITDTIAMTSAMSATIMIFWCLIHRNSKAFLDILPFSIFLTWIALLSMSLAFVTGLFVVLSEAMVLAIVVCVIGSAAPAFLYIFAPLWLKIIDY